MRYGDCQRANEQLAEFLRATDEAKIKQLKDRLQEVATPIIRMVICRKLRIATRALDGALPSREGQDAQDLCIEVGLLLWRRLQARSTPAEGPINDFCRYVARIATNTCNSYLRGRYPARYNLADRVRWVLENRTPLSDFAVWEDGSEELTGLRAWLNRGMRLRRGRRYQAVQAQSELFTRALAPQTPTETPLSELLSALFHWVGEPIEWGDLIEILQDLLGVRELKPWRVEGGESAGEDTCGKDPMGYLPHPQPDILDRIVRHETLKELWTRIGRLPLLQRQALLLNLRDDGDGCTIDQFPVLALATVRQIGDLLEIPYERFKVLWPELPLPDHAIAEHLKKTPQQVRNLRMMARRSLQTQFL